MSAATHTLIPLVAMIISATVAAIRRPGPAIASDI